ELRRPDLPAAAREHGGRHPGHLRRLDHGVPADGRRARPRRPGPRQLLLAQRVGLHRRRDDLHHPLHVLLHRGHLQPGRPGGQPQEVRRLHPRRATRAADGRVPGPHPRAADLPRRAVPGGRGGPADDHHQPDLGQLLLRRHLDPHRDRRGPRHHEAARGAADDAQLRGLPEV
ncbi:MAG: Protein translocase subunit SecY, partial [uncultured Solirubrobacteraceae bacterium]